MAGVVMTLVAGCASAPSLPPLGRRCPVAARGGPLLRLAWLVGSWLHQPGDDAQRLQQERWSAPCGGLMLGQSRTIRAGRATGFEFMSLRSDASGGITYRAWPGGKQGTRFKLVELKSRRAVFENRAHDFPQRIVYRRFGDRLEAQIEGPQHGRWQKVRWTFTRRR